MRWKVGSGEKERQKEGNLTPSACALVISFGTHISFPGKNGLVDNRNFTPDPVTGVNAKGKGKGTYTC